jgi:putative tricarboxylic transport membrane protein
MNMAATFRVNKGDLISGAVLAGLGGYIVLEARQWEYTGLDGPGPGFFPIWYGIIMIVMSLALMASSLRRPGPPGESVNWKELGRAFASWAAMAGSILLYKPLGFLIAFALFTWFVVTVLYGRSVARGLAVGAGASLCFYVIFPLGLDVRLPVGILGI